MIEIFIEINIPPKCEVFLDKNQSLRYDIQYHFLHTVSTLRFFCHTYSIEKFHDIQL